MCATNPVLYCAALVSLNNVSGQHEIFQEHSAFSLIVHDWKTVSLFSRFSRTLSLLPTEGGEGKTVETCKCNVHFQSIPLENIRSGPAEPPEEPEHAPTGSLCFYGLVLTLAAERVGCCRLGSEPQCSVVFTLLSNCLISQQ